MRRDAARWSMVLAAAGLFALAAAVHFGLDSAGVPRLCAEGLVQLGARCCGESQRLEGARCVGAPTRCGPDQRMTPDGCVARDERVSLTGGRVERLPTDWDDRSRAGGEGPWLPGFAIDRHEVTEAAYRRCVEAGVVPAAPSRGEPGLPQTDVTAAEAEACCGVRGGRLPTSSEFAYAAMGRTGRRYPWGDAGAVCRRVVHGLVDGPCGHGATGPQLAGSAMNGSSPEGVADLAGNVEEWVKDGGGALEARGGHFRDESVTALRSFATRRVSVDRADTARGFRCVYALGAR